MSENTMSDLSDEMLAETIRLLVRQLEAAIDEASERRMEVRIENVGTRTPGLPGNSVRFSVRITKEV